MTRWTALFAALFAACLAFADDGKLTEEQVAELTRYFGFGEMQIYKIEHGISDLNLADLNLDGRTDALLWNGYKSRFELFYQPDPDEPAPSQKKDLERNEISSRGNLRRENVPVSYRVASTEIADVTSDGRPDIIFFGEPRELVILPGKSEGGFAPPLATRAPEGEPRPHALAVGDFNSDGRTDIALLGTEVLLIFTQKPDGGLEKPSRIVHGIRNVGMLLSGDLNGDGRADLMIGADDEQYGVYVSIQDEQGNLSALRRIKIPDLRSITVAPAKGGDDLFVIENVTGHLRQYRWEISKETSGTADWPQRLYSYPLKVKAKRVPVAIGDLTGDGLEDCIVAAPEAARLMLFSGTAQGLAAGRAFPGLIKTSDLLIADTDGDGKPELLSVSAEEKTLGVSDFADGRITFPRPFPVGGKPLAVAFGALRAGDSGGCLACALMPTTPSAEDKEDDERDEDDELAIDIYKPGSDEVLTHIKCDKADEVNALRFADVNQDGRNDLLLFSRFSDPQTFLQSEDGKFAPFKGADTRSSLLKGTRIEGFSLNDVTGDGKAEVLLAERGLVRALVVQDGHWTVVDQYNPESADAEITGLAVLPDGTKSPTIVMYDRKARDLLVQRRRDDGTYAVAQTMPVGDYDLSAMRPLIVGKAGRPALLMVDAERLSLLNPGEVAPTLVPHSSYESDAKDAWLADSVVGDLNHDGVRDVVAVDARKSSLEILTTAPDGDLVRAMRFQVFQGKRFSDEPSSYGEPRQVLIGDLTNDGIDDIALLVHDRLIIYPSQ